MSNLRLTTMDLSPVQDVSSQTVRFYPAISRLARKRTEIFSARMPDSGAQAVSAGWSRDLSESRQWRVARYDGTSTRTGPLQSEKN